MPAITKAPKFLRVATKPSGTASPNVDREKGIIYGYSVIEAGPALGHDVDIDQKSLEMVHALGVAAGDRGVKSHFAHQNLSGDGIGKFLGRSKNFRLEDGRVRADLHLSRTAYDTPSGNLATYILDLAEEDPSAFGASIVNDGKTETLLNKDGTRKKGADGKPLNPVLRPGKLKAVDMVDDPAANTGGLSFSEGKLPDWAARDVSAVLDKLFGSAEPDVVLARTNDFIQSYLATRGKKMSGENDPKGTETPPKQDPPADPPKDLTTNDPPKDPPKQDPPAALSAADVARIADERVQVEQKRCRDINALCSEARASELADGFIKNNLSVAEVNEKLVKHLSTQNPPVSEGGGQAPTDLSALEAKFKADYQRNLAWHQEIGTSEEEYVRSEMISAGKLQIAPKPAK